MHGIVTKLFAVLLWLSSAVNAATIVFPAQGGTGVANNNAATITRSGNHALTITTTGTTGVTLPTTGTLIPQGGDIGAATGISLLLTGNSLVGGTSITNPNGWASILQIQGNQFPAISLRKTGVAAQWDIGNNNGPLEILDGAGNTWFSLGITGIITPVGGRFMLGGAAPSMGACGTSPSVAGTSSAGTITIGTGGAATSCAITFAAAWATAPACVSNHQGAILVTRSISTTTTLTIDAATPLTASGKLDYICVGR